MLYFCPGSASRTDRIGSIFSPSLPQLWHNGFSSHTPLTFSPATSGPVQLDRFAFPGSLFRRSHFPPPRRMPFSLLLPNAARVACPFFFASLRRSFFFFCVAGALELAGRRPCSTLFSFPFPPPVDATSFSGGGLLFTPGTAPLPTSVCRSSPTPCGGRFFLSRAALLFSGPSLPFFSWRPPSGDSGGRRLWALISAGVFATDGPSLRERSCL